ncbi:sulfotransferase [Oceaniferula spumae]|uniref:Sulfotransferase n=1 Tax=Oceaniferula spumae TaxID=2979115 RepID=A0AAT9FHM8_9BACT
MGSARKTAYYQDTPELQEARANWVAKDYRRSLRLFERAAKRDPYNLMALKDAAYAFGQHFEIQTATKYIKRMTSLAGNDPGALHVISDAWRDASRPKEAMTALHKAVDSGNARPETYLCIALAQERSHKLDEALESLERFLKMQPGAAEGLRLKALLLRRLGNIDQAKDIYRSMHDYCGSGNQLILAQALNEWANVLDLEGDYDAAFDKIQQSKKILQKSPEAPGLLAREYQERVWFDQFIDSLTPDNMENWAGRSERTDSNVILTGCPRSGTTLIEKVLDAHSEIISAEELGVFSTYIVPRLFNQISEDDFDGASLDSLPGNMLRREAQNYRRYMEAAIDEKLGGRVLIDKVPSSTMVIPFMLRLLPGTHVLYALRDPRDIVVSCFMCWMQQNTVSTCFYNLEETVKRTVCELRWWSKLKELLPGDRWYETRYEDTVKDVTRESQRILGWLDLPWEDGVNQYREHLQERGVISPTYESVNKPVYQRAVGRWKNYEKHLQPYLANLEETAEVLGYS